MFLVLRVVTALLVSLAMSLALAHALELPGKMRLDKQTYIAVQAIYYPGLTIGGFGEPLAIVAVLVLLLTTPSNRVAFWWTLTALVSLLAMQASYWILTHPVNKFWLKDRDLKGAGAGFFSFDPMKREEIAETGREDWTRFRNRWEYSHVLRAAMSLIAQIAIIMAIAM